MRPEKTDPLSKSQAAVAAFALTLLSASAALAQAAGGSDVIGVSPIVQIVIYTFKAIALAGIGYGFIRLFSGRHTVEGLVVMAVGGLGLAKIDAVAAAMGLA